MTTNQPPVSRRWVVFFSCVLFTAALVAYSNSFTVPFIFDDGNSVQENLSIRNISDLQWLHQFTGTAGGRPLTNLSFGVNYSLGGLSPYGYHIGNFLIHFLCGLTIFIWLSQVLARQELPHRIRQAALYLAFGCTLLWICHPINSYTVTYISQRSEELMSLFYILVIYSFWTWQGPNTNKRWPYIAIALCWCGMACKEGMATAPLMVLIVDRTFFSKGFLQALKLRAWFYVGLASSWSLVLALYFSSPGRGAGLNTNISSFKYALTECHVLFLYLKLIFFPSPLVFDYGTTLYRENFREIPFAIALICVLSVCLYFFIKKPWLGLACVWFFVLLCPSSSVIPVTPQPMGENRIYLAALGPLIIFVCLSYLYLRQITWVIVGAATCACGQLTLNRNEVCSSLTSLWFDTAAKVPRNIRAQCNLGSALLLENRVEEAGLAFDRALAINPEWPQVFLCKGDEMLKRGDKLRAEAWYKLAVDKNPKLFDGWRKFGGLIQQRGDNDGAENAFRTALQLQPTDALSWVGLGNVMLARGQKADALHDYEKAIEIDFDIAVAHNDRGYALLTSGDKDGAIEEFFTATEVEPLLPKPHANLGTMYARDGKYTQAIDQYLCVLYLDPGDFEIRANLGMVYQLCGKVDIARSCYQYILRRDPQNARAAELLKKLGQPMSKPQLAVK